MTKGYYVEYEEDFWDIKKKVSHLVLNWGKDWGKNNSKRKNECPVKTIKAIQLASNRTKQMNCHVTSTRKIKIKNCAVMNEDPGIYTFIETF